MTLSKLIHVHYRISSFKNLFKFFDKVEMNCVANFTDFSGESQFLFIEIDGPFNRTETAKKHGKHARSSQVVGAAAKRKKVISISRICANDISRVTLRTWQKA